MIRPISVVAAKIWYLQKCTVFIGPPCTYNTINYLLLISIIAYNTISYHLLINIISFNYVQYNHYRQQRLCHVTFKQRLKTFLFCKFY